MRSECRRRSIGAVRGRWAFTLIELLVVISVIALIISILLPALRGARLASQHTVCKSNIRQIGIAVRLYAYDYQDRVWPVSVDAGTNFPPNGAAWARIPEPDGSGGGSVRPGFLYDYVDAVDQIGECPSNRRSTSMSDIGSNMFNGDTPLDFDYTMVANAQGARLDRRTQMGYLVEPDAYPNWTLPPLTPPEETRMRRFSWLAIFIEEHTVFWNEQYMDGLWSNADQFETRHAGGANVAFVEGHVETFKPPRGNLERIMEPGDLDTNDIYVRARGQWVRMERQSGVLRPFGWINNPERALP